MNYISPEHILAAILTATAGGNARAVVQAVGVDPDQLKARALKKLKGDAEAGAGRPKAGAGGRAGGERGGGEKSALAELTRDLCAEAAAGSTDPVIGRDKEVVRVVQILARRSKNNPMLIGEPGVGKTAIAEGLARAIVSRALPDGSPLPAFLEGKRVLSLDLGLVLAGAKERGELESRVTKMLAEIDAAGDVILMIDEIHTLVGAGSVGGRGGGGGGGGMDIANLLKPPLARGGLQCVGATTLDEFRKHIERDPALERRFQPVMVGEPTEAEAATILEGLAPRYAAHHRVAYAPDALLACVALSSRYVADRFLPDKAIDVMDEAGSRARIDAFEARKKAAEAGDAAEGPAGAGPHAALTDADAASAWDDLAALAAAMAAAADEGDFEEAASLAAREADLRAAAVGSAADGAPVPLVTRADVEKVVAAWTRIPVETLAPDEQARVLALGPALADRVIGQADATRAVARAMLRARSGLASPDRPIAGMLFSGPTGVGKTELTKALAETYFGSADSIVSSGLEGEGVRAPFSGGKSRTANPIPRPPPRQVRLDMSEYMERHTVAKLVGPPPGYVGYGEGGKLTEAVRRRPHCVVREKRGERGGARATLTSPPPHLLLPLFQILLDEVEKAHPDVFNILLQVLEDGRLTDSEGRTVSFKNALLVMTSNVGAHVVAKGGRALGFDIGPEEDAAGRAYGRVKSLVMEELKTFFRPELLNRLDEVVVFRQLDKVGGKREEGKRGGRMHARPRPPLLSPPLLPDPHPPNRRPGARLHRGPRLLTRHAPGGDRRPHGPHRRRRLRRGLRRTPAQARHHPPRGRPPVRRPAGGRAGGGGCRAAGRGGRGRQGRRARHRDGAQTRRRPPARGGRHGPEIRGRLLVAHRAAPGQGGGRAQGARGQQRQSVND